MIQDDAARLSARDEITRDQIAWDELTASFGPRMWAVARAFGLSAADAADAVQAAWLRLVERWETIREPDRIGAWLVTTTRNEAARLCRKARGERLTGEPPDLAQAETDPAVAVLSADEGRRLWQAVDALPEPCRTLLRLLVTTPDAGYARIAARLNLPVGSIGPTRGRCLSRLRKLLGDAT
jgi:RNA polymerase sigma factor (sigma-70 family)